MKRERKIQGVKTNGEKSADQSKENGAEKRREEQEFPERALDSDISSIPILSQEELSQEETIQGLQESRATQDRPEEKTVQGRPEGTAAQDQSEEKQQQRRTEEKTVLRRTEENAGKIRDEKAQNHPEERSGGMGQNTGGGKEARYQQKLNSLRQGKSRANVIAVIAVVVAVLAVLLCIVFYSAQYNRRMTVIAPVGDITFVDKHKEEDLCFVTFQAADYNRIPSEINTQGITVQVEPEIYDLIAIDINYGSANIVFEVPQGVARKAGYDEEQMNIQKLWTEDILKKYASARSIVWSVAY